MTNLRDRKVHWVRQRYEPKKVQSKKSFHFYKLFTVISGKATRIINSFINGIVKRIGGKRKRISRSGKSKIHECKKTSYIYKVFSGFSYKALSIMNRKWHFGTDS